MSVEADVGAAVGHDGRTVLVTLHGPVAPVLSLERLDGLAMEAQPPREAMLRNRQLASWFGAGSAHCSHAFALGPATSAVLLNPGLLDGPEVVSLLEQLAEQLGADGNDGLLRAHIAQDSAGLTRSDVPPTGRLRAQCVGLERPPVTDLQPWAEALAAWTGDAPVHVEFPRWVPVQVEAASLPAIIAAALRDRFQLRWLADDVRRGGWCYGYEAAADLIGYGPSWDDAATQAEAAIALVRTFDPAPRGRVRHAHRHLAGLRRRPLPQGLPQPAGPARHR